MKGKNPTREQRKFLSSVGLSTRDWLVQKDSPNAMQVVHRVSGEEKVIPKGES